MKILVCLKQVPAQDAPLKLNPQSTWIREEVGFEINEPDAYALEEALRQKEAHAGGEVVAITVGPARASQALREALAKGADRAIHVEGDASDLDPYAVAEAITRAIAGESFDLVLTGLQSDDAGFGQSGVIVAELLGAPHATIVMQIEAREGRVRVKRELEGGFFQWAEMPTPAVLTIQSGINKLRYATLLGIKQARNKPLTQLSLAELGVSPSLNRQRRVRLLAPVRNKKTEIIAGSPEEAAVRLVEKLRMEARAI